MISTDGYAAVMSSMTVAYIQAQLFQNLQQSFITSTFVGLFLGLFLGKAFCCRHPRTGFTRIDREALHLANV